MQSEAKTKFLLDVHELLAEHQQLIEHQRQLDSERAALVGERVRCIAAQSAIRARLASLLVLAVDDSRDEAVGAAVQSVLDVMATHETGVALPFD